MAHFFTATAAALIEGIETRDGRIILGEAGRERKELRIPVTAPLIGGRVIAGALVTGSATRIEPGEGGASMAVRIKTDACYTRGAPGSLAVAGGWLVAAEGRTAWGDAGRLGSHPDAIVVTRTPGACRITFAGGRSKGYGVRWLVALDRGADHMSVFLLDCSPEARVAGLRPGAVGFTPQERYQAYELCRDVKGTGDAALADLKVSLGNAISEGRF